VGFDAWLTLGVVISLLAVLLLNLVPPDVAFLAAALLLAATGVVSVEESLAGFANPGMLTVAFLFVVAAALRETGLLDAAGQRVLGKARTERAAMRRLAALVLPMSAFLNNTPIVAMFMPIVLDWSRRNGHSASRLLIPLSYMSILGGTCTLIGTSTTLVIQGLMVSSGVEPMTLFEISAIGVPYALVGLLYLRFFAGRLLPQRKEFLEQLGESRREFLVEMVVQPGSRLVGQTIEEAGLRHLPALFLIEIDRNGTVVGPVNPADRLQANDRLVFTGVVSSIVELERIPGLVPALDPTYDVLPRDQRRRQLCEAVISERSPLVGKTIREANFRAHYGAAVVAVHRGGSRIKGRVGDIELRRGDTLLLQTPPHFVEARRNDPAFYLVSDVHEWRAVRSDRAPGAILVFAALVVAMTTGWLSIVLAAGIAAVTLVLLGCLSVSAARRSIEWEVLVTIASAFAVGQAMENSGLAAGLAEPLVDLAGLWGPIAALAGIYLLGSILTELITNNAAAVLLFPFCLETARLLDVSSRPFLMALALAASASFMTPIGYQTNMMVYGPGGYRFGDYLRVGTPLNLLLMGVAMVLVPRIWPF
jgi:di/tricarboxylate transporter